MLSEENGYCPDCWCEMNTRGMRCCGDCWEKRKRAIVERVSNVGCESSPESFEMSDIGRRHTVGDWSYRNVPGLRKDVTWHRGKHGAG